MDARTLEALFRVDVHAARANCDGLSEEDAVRPPEPGGNPANWVLGHIVEARGAVLRALGKAHVLEAGEAETYARGATFDATKRLPMAELLERLDRSQRRIEEGLQALSEDELGRPLGEDEKYPPGFETVYDKLAFLQFHEAYHIGQLALLRRMAGKEGAIR